MPGIEDPRSELFPFMAVEKTIINNVEHKILKIDVAECESMFSIIINDECYVRDMPRTEITNTKLNRFYELIFALKTGLLVANFAGFGEEKIEFIKIEIATAKYGPNDVGFGLRLWIANDIEISDCIRFRDEVGDDTFPE